MHCTEFIEGHSEYVDGALAPAAAGRWRRHVERCRSCARYDRVVRASGDLVREVLPRVESSDDFAPRLRHRLYHVRDDLGRRVRGPAMLAAAVAILAAGGAFGLALREPAPLIVEAAAMRAAPPQLVGPATPVTVARPAAAPATERVGPDNWPVYSPASFAAEFTPVRAGTETPAVRATLLLNE